MFESGQVNDRGSLGCRLESLFISIASVIQSGCCVDEQLVYQSHRGSRTGYPEECLFEYQRKMRVRMDVDISIDNGCQISQTIDLATFFSAAARAMRDIHGVKLSCVISAVILWFAKPDEE